MVMKRQRVFLRRLRRFFVTTVLGGLLVVLPITLLVLVVRFVVNFITDLLDPVKQLLSFPNNINDWIVDLIAFALVIIAFFIIGLVVRTELGERFFKKLEMQWLGQIPFYTTIRDTLTQFFNRDKMPFSQVVLIDPFGSGSQMTGFVTDELESDWYTVFVPTAPNPTNGFVFHVKAEKVRFLNVKPEEAMRSIIAMGSGSKVLFDPARVKPNDGQGKKQKKENDNSK